MSNTFLILAALCLLHALPATAQDQSPDTLGRLFFSPQARAALERQRQLNPGGDHRIQGEVLSVNGVVRRSGGGGTTWINGMAQHHGTAQGVTLRYGTNEPSRTTLRVGEESPVTLQVGESINRSTGEKQDGLAGGRIIVRRSASGSPPSRP